MHGPCADRARYDLGPCTDRACWHRPCTDRARFSSLHIIQRVSGANTEFFRSYPCMAPCMAPYPQHARTGTDRAQTGHGPCADRECTCTDCARIGHGPCTVLARSAAMVGPMHGGIHSAMQPWRGPILVFPQAAATTAASGFPESGSYYCCSSPGCSFDCCSFYCCGCSCPLQPLPPLLLQLLLPQMLLLQLLLCSFHCCSCYCCSCYCCGCVAVATAAAGAARSIELRIARSVHGPRTVRARCHANPAQPL